MLITSFMLIQRQGFVFYRALSAMTTSKVKIAVCQMTCSGDKLSNLTQAKTLITESKELGAQMVFLPECFDAIYENSAMSIEAAESLEGNLIRDYQQTAKQLNLWLSLGGFKEKSERDDRIYNTHMLVNPNGEISAVYRKLHLFDVDMPGKVRLCESDFALPGQDICPPIPTVAGKVGLSTCYDLRFPELSSLLQARGADILTFPSAFTVPTGQAHWESLLRARAIENQCYVIAAAQVGKHNSKRESYGHSMVIDPWGKIMCEIPSNVGVATADIDLSYLNEVRKAMPVAEHRRSDVYQLTGSFSDVKRHNIDGVPHYMFSEHKIPSACVFYQSELSYAFVNRKPVVPGHMLVAPLRVVKRFTELTKLEIADLFEVAKHVGAAIEKQFNASSLTVAIQDGADAGQTVEHVHVHILPRKKGDFERNDDIYEKLQSHDKDADGEPLQANSGLWRSVETMADEAAHMRKYFTSFGR